MEFNEDLQFDPISPEPEEPPVSETPEMPQEDTAWHGTGAGQQEYFTASPSDAWVDQQNVSEPVTEAAPEEAPETAPVSEPQTIPETEAKTTEPEATVPETDTESETQPQKKGCGAAIGTASVGIALTACAAVLKKKKED